MEILTFPETTFYKIPKQDNPLFEEDNEACLVICKGPERKYEEYEVISIEATGGKSWVSKLIGTFPSINNAEIFAKAFASPITEQDIKDLKGVRVYFGEHDKTITEHKNYAVIDSVINKLEK